MRRNPLACTALAAMALVSIRVQPALATGPEMPSQAETLFEQAQTHYNLGEYEAAISLFRRSYELSQEPLLIFNIAQALRLKGDCLRARDSYRNFLRLAAESKRPDLAGEQQMAQGHMVSLDRSCQPEPPLETRSPSTVARPLVHPPSPSVESAAPSRPRRLRPVIWSLAGAGVASSALGIYFATEVRRQSKAASDAPRFDPSRSDQGRRTERLQWVSLGGGAVALGAAGVLAWLDHRSGRPGLMVRPHVAFDEVGLTVNLTH